MTKIKVFSWNFGKLSNDKLACINRNVFDIIEESTIYVIGLQEVSGFSLNKIKAGGYSFFMGTIYKLKLDNINMIEIPIIFNDRHHGKSKIPKIEIFRTLFNLIKILLKKSV